MKISTPQAILIGSVLIALAILFRADDFLFATEAEPESAGVDYQALSQAPEFKQAVKSIAEEAISGIQFNFGWFEEKMETIAESAVRNHDHSYDYSPTDHSHSARHHSHDGDYSAIYHTHDFRGEEVKSVAESVADDAVGSAIRRHDHSSDYAASGHSHDIEDEIESFISRCSVYGSASGTVDDERFYGDVDASIKCW